MRIEATCGAPYVGGGNTAPDDPVSGQIKKQIQETKKELQELSADKSVPVDEKAEKQKELNKKLNDLNSRLRQHELDKQQEQRKKAAEKQREKTETADSLKEREKRTPSLDQDTVQALTAADSGQAMAVKREGVRMDLSHEALSLSIAIKRQEQWEGGVSPLRSDLNGLYEDMGELAADTLSELRGFSKAVEEAVQKKPERDNGKEGDEDKDENAVTEDKDITGRE